MSARELSITSARRLARSATSVLLATAGCVVALLPAPLTRELAATRVLITASGLLTGLEEARIEAARRHVPVYLCAVADAKFATPHCLAGGDAWSGSWIVFVGAAPSASPQTDASARILHRSLVALPGVEVRAIGLVSPIIAVVPSTSDRRVAVVISVGIPAGGILEPPSRCFVVDRSGQLAPGFLVGAACSDLHWDASPTAPRVSLREHAPAVGCGALGVPQASANRQVSVRPRAGKAPTLGWRVTTLVAQARARPGGTVSARIFELRPQPSTILVRWDQIHELVMSHGRRVAHLAYPLARRWGLTHSESLRIAEAGYLHDLGKVALPASILFKSDALSEADRLIVETHTTIGYRLISRFATTIHLDYRLAAAVSLHHHERWDGSGYPLGLRTDAIPFEAQLIAVVDVFDALVSGRTYKAPWPVSLALAELHDSAGTRFNAKIVALFADMVEQSLSPNGAPCPTDQDLALDVLANRAFMDALLRRGTPR